MQSPFLHYIYSPYFKDCILKIIFHRAVTETNLQKTLQNPGLPIEEYSILICMQWITETMISIDFSVQTSRLYFLSIYLLKSLPALFIFLESSLNCLLRSMTSVVQQIRDDICKNFIQLLTSQQTIKCLICFNSLKNICSKTVKENPLQPRLIAVLSQIYLLMFHCMNCFN